MIMIYGMTKCPFISSRTLSFYEPNLVCKVNAQTSTVAPVNVGDSSLLLNHNINIVVVYIKCLCEERSLTVFIQQRVAMH